MSLECTNLLNNVDSQYKQNGQRDIENQRTYSKYIQSTFYFISLFDFSNQRTKSDREKDKLNQCIINSTSKSSNSTSK